jgi:hypothetical protein
VLTDDAKGEHDEHITYNDTDVEQIKSIPEEAIHRNVDLTLLAADKEGESRRGSHSLTVSDLVLQATSGRTSFSLRRYTASQPDPSSLRSSRTRTRSRSRRSSRPA